MSDDHAFPELEAGMRKIMDLVKSVTPPGIGVTVFYSAFEPRREFAWGSTCQREDMWAAIFGLMGRQDPAMIKRALARARNGDG
jgi:hypothetical protein